jgi:hypothetical protein
MKASPALALFLLIGCSGTADRAEVVDSTPAAAPAPRDSLALRTPAGVEVWYTLTRPGQSADGRACVDRALEIRREGSRIPVPLLYTGTPPELVDDTTMRARLSDGCAPGQSYLVDLRTGRPTPER